MKIKFFISAFFLAVMVITISSSCEKKTDCRLTIKTVDVTGAPVANANIKLYANIKAPNGSTVEADLKAEGVSDDGGSSSYTFKLPAILDIKATSSLGTGVGIIKLEEGKSVEKTVTIK